MEPKNGIVNARSLAIVGGITSVISVFLPWFIASASTGTADVISRISVNGLGSVSGSGMLLGLISEKANWEFQGIGVLVLGMVSIVAALFLRDKLQSIAMSACGILIIGGGVVNIQSIELFSGDFLGATIQSEVGYGLYVVVIAGAIAASGGLLACKRINK